MEAGFDEEFAGPPRHHDGRSARGIAELPAGAVLSGDDAGMVWEPGEEAWETKLAMLRAFRRAHGHLAPRQDAVWGDAEGELVPVGQHMANLRRKGGLGKDQERAEMRAKQLTAIDEDWACPWPLDWQRHYRVLADLVEADGILPAIEPGVLFEGDDLGRWLQRQANSWTELPEEQQRRLSALGIKPAERPTPAPVTKAAEKASAAFQRGIATLAQYIAREDHRAVPRGHLEPVVIDG
ncbi:helicase associated domain-containing protein [Streptomyces sp. NPDC001514]